MHYQPKMKNGPNSGDAERDWGVKKWSGGAERRVGYAIMPIMAKDQTEVAKHREATSISTS